MEGKWKDNGREMEGQWDYLGQPLKTITKELISQKLPKMIQKTKWNSDKNVRIVKNDNKNIAT